MNLKHFSGYSRWRSYKSRILASLLSQQEKHSLSSHQRNMSDGQILRTHGQVLSALVENLARNSTTPSPEKLHQTGVIDLGQSSQNKPSKSKPCRKKKTVTIDEIFPDPIPKSTEEDHDFKVVADSEDEEQQSQDDMQDQIATDSEDETQQHDGNCPDLMELKRLSLCKKSWNNV
ncbi:hypothetical protein Bca101_096152 [Brassica carinata]